MPAPIFPTGHDPYPWGVAERDPDSRLPTSGDQSDLPLAIACLDLTTLEGSDTPETVRQVCDIAKANRVAAVCVYPLLVPAAVNALKGSGIKVACAAGGFPHALTPIEARLTEIRYSLDHGADEVDIVMNRSAFLSGDYRQVVDETSAMNAACDSKTMKVILETGDLQNLDAIRNASFIAMQAGADFLKTSTGKIAKGATPEAVLTIADAIRDYRKATGKQIGIKPSGGIRAASDAVRYVAIVREALGEDWLNLSLFRIGASRIFERAS